MSPLKRRRTLTVAPPPEATAPALTLPHEIVLEIVARSDAATFVRCAASCKPLRRDVLRPAFIRRACHGPHGGVPPRVVGFLHAYDEARAAPPPAPFSLAHPATPAAASFAEELAPFVSRSAAAAAAGGLLGDYEPLTSRNGLVVLRRRYVGAHRPGICVYDPMTGGRAFLPGPPDIDTGHAPDYGVSYTYVLLTAADGIAGSSCFLLLAADFAQLTVGYSGDIRVQTVSPDAAGGGGKWGPVTWVSDPRSARSELQPRCNAVVLGGLIHWLMYRGYWHFHILTYDVRTAAAGSIELPEEALHDGCRESSLHLAPSPDGRLSLLVADRRKISVWLLPPSAGGGWSRHAMIDTGKMLKWSLVPGYDRSWWLDRVVKFASSGARSDAILLRPFTKWHKELVEEGGEGLAVLDVEKKEVRVVPRRAHTMNFPYEVDLEAQLSAMKIF
ncbi:hypothetical protein ACP70R_025070 [Stipagrostis hirtigluma subsp. patula]